ncbi:MAG: glycosyltransferase family 4 protein [Microvirga sp.]|nr:glycosyltransferase family 4 protein [Beijerinckiaceae bacterium]
MLEVAFAVPGDIDAPTGGYAYARKLSALAPGFGVNLTHIRLPGGFPHPSRDELAQTEQLLSARRRPLHLVDGLAYGALPADLVRRLPGATIALVHHPLAFESGLAPERRDALLCSEREALAEAKHVIASSRFTARLLAADFNVPPDKLSIAEPGTEPAQRAKGAGSPVRLLAVGAVSPRKGYDVLVRALAGMRDLQWRLTIAGSLDRAPQTADTLAALIAAEGLSRRIALTGAVDDATLARLYDGADVFVSPSLFEGYGMVLAEAMARGLPIVASTGGAAAETVPDAAAIKVPPGDAAALAAALAGMIADAPLRRRFADASWAAGRALPRWSDTAAAVAAVLKQAAA